ncbi:hypothetical protein FACS1894137_13230 [Spirochaetia bacterium]|nr:hypothetical protein FACS1894137_13230 [Spirochaetia bacterium]
MNKARRPTKYSRKLCKKLPDMFLEGQSVVEVCADLGIWKDTFYQWVNKYPEFSDAYKKGLLLSEAWWEKLGRAGATGQISINPATWIFNMKNRFKWTDKQDLNVSGTMTFDTAAAAEKLERMVLNDKS